MPTHQALQQIKSDFLNVAHCWLYSVLYYHQIYPPTVFELRDVYGVLAPVTTSPKLKQYVTKLFKQLENSIFNLNFLEIQLVASGRPLLSHRLLAGIIQTNYYNNRHQKQAELKYFLHDLIKSFRNNLLPIAEATFNFYVQYRSDGTQKTKGGLLADNWLIHHSESTEDDQQILGTTLKLPDMNIIISRKILT